MVVNVSVVIPTYNRSDIIIKTLMSVKNQTFSQWECIIVDDGSVDSTEEVITEFTRTDERFKFIKRPESRIKGANTCRNIGIENSIGKFIAFLDSDDEWKCNRLNLAYQFLENENYDALYSGAEISNGIETFKRGSRSIELNESLFDFTLNHETFAPTPSLIVRADIARKVKFDENLLRHQDFDFFIRVGEELKWCYFDNYDVVVHWPINMKRNIDYESCCTFYEKHVIKSKNKDIRVKYLKWISERCGKDQPNRKAIKFFKEQLKKENNIFSLRELFLLNFPVLFNFIFKIKSKYA
jgi:glycosyltransferase involved in cell wall biosynthesis